MAEFAGYAEAMAEDALDPADGAAHPTPGRVDLRKVREASESSTGPPLPAVCGLPQLLMVLQQGVDWQEVSETNLGEEPVWRLRGQWQDSNGQPHVPQQVELLLSRASDFAFS